jgi:putative endonuclease
VNARQQLGRAAETAAARFLAGEGWSILGRNVRVGRGELDHIVRRGAVLAFVEVKARRTSTFGSPEDAVDARKRRRVARLGELWLAARPWALRGISDVRFDIVAVDACVRPPAIRHLHGAFTLDG